METIKKIILIFIIALPQLLVFSQSNKEPIISDNQSFFVGENSGENQLVGKVIATDPDLKPVPEYYDRTFETSPNLFLVDVEGNEQDVSYSTLKVKGMWLDTLREGSLKEVRVNIRHPWVKDLSLHLISPQDRIVLLSNRNGDDGANYESTVFTMKSNNLIGNATAPFTGSFLPEDNLDEVVGDIVNGVWQLRIVDNKNGDLGKLISWSITLVDEIFQELSYSIVGGNSNDAFKIDEKTGEIYVNNTAAIDFENTPDGVYNLTVEVKDNHITDSKSDRAIVKININNKNDNTPVFNDKTFYVDEFTGQDITFEAFEATDADGDKLTYSIVGGNTNDAFKIDKDKLIVNNALEIDYETNSEFNLKIRSTDGTNNDDANFKIIVNNTNDLPDFFAQSITIDENFEGIVTAFNNKDKYNEKVPVAFEIISGNSDNAFVIRDNFLEVLNKDAIDFEAHPVFYITIRITDNTFSKDAIYTIELNNLNDNEPVFGNAETNVIEHPPDKSTIIQLVASDADNNPLSFSIVDGNIENAFAVEGNNLIANKPSSIDFERYPEFNVKLKTFDGQFSTIANYKITVQNENDLPDFTEQLIEIDENYNATITTLNTKDQYGLIVPVFFEIIGGNANNTFVIENDKLKVGKVDDVDYEKSPVFSLTIKMSDGTFSKNANITINLKNLNDNNPQINDFSATVDENALNGTKIISLTASDADGNDVYFNISAGNNEGIFRLSQNKIVVNNNSLLNYEATSEYSLTIEATDGEKASSSTLSISVNDNNDAPEKIELSNNTILEASEINTEIGIFSTIDPDATDSHSYQLVSGVGGYDNALFSIDNNILKSNTVFDFEEKKNFSIRIKSIDSGNNSIDEVFTISINNVNDPPIIPQIPQYETIEDKGIQYITIPGLLDGDDGSQELNLSAESSNTSLISKINIVSLSGGQAILSYQPLTNQSGNTTITLTLKDNGGRENNGTDETTSSFSIRVLPQNDAPETLSISNAVISENEGMGAFIGTFSVNDNDDNDVHTYTLVFDQNNKHEDNSEFTIDKDGNLYLKYGIDYEVKDLYRIFVRSSDNGEPVLYTEQAFTISVKDESEPTEKFYINEDAALNTLVGSINAGAITSNPSFRFIDALNDAFIIDSQTGDIYVNNQSLLDFESNNLINLTVAISDTEAGTLRQYRHISIYLLDVDETQYKSTFFIPENSPANTPVGIISNTGYSQSDIYFEFSHESFEFQINQQTGHISIKQNALLDYEQTQKYELEVNLIDKQSDVIKGTSLVTILLTDVIETDFSARNVFTPNGDGKNEYWEIEHVDRFQNYKLIIYNERGAIVYKTDNYANNWNGTNNGDELPVGVYYYLFKCNDCNMKYTGAITLLR